MAQIKKILLIDDDEVTNIMHKRMIKKSGCAADVLVATDGLAALELLDQHQVDGIPLPEMILLDINMPRMDGFEFLEEYAARNLGDQAERIVVMLSTSLMRSDHDRAKRNPNVHSFVTKMIAPETFLGLVDEISGDQIDGVPAFWQGKGLQDASVTTLPQPV